MTRFIGGVDREQATLFPERLDEYVEEDNPVRVVDVFIDGLDLDGLGFDVVPETTGRPGYHPATLLKIYLYGYLNQIQSLDLSHFRSTRLLLGIMKVCYSVASR